MKIIILCLCIDLLIFGISVLGDSIVSGIITIVFASLAGLVLLTNKNTKWWRLP
jgi:hypothetical protein